MQDIQEETPQLCAHADELVAYLYHEASETEAREFEAHMRRCETCQTELAAFSQVRGSIDEWRQQSLGAPGYAHGTAAVATTATLERKRSALAALREFFTLSPMWMRAATAVVTVCACALVALAVARAEFRWDDDGISFRTGVASERIVERTRTVQVENPVKVGYSKEELDQIVEARVRQERESFQKRQPTQEVKFTPAGTRPRTAVARNSAQSSGSNPSQQTVAQRDPLSEEDLPRLYDLLGETN
ncbi:MAG: zf-HC2 domain-containing protein [Pyrinomonadaceae bacterium]